jgi:hypothetical protein
MEIQNAKGWSMKQSDKTPFFEKEDAVFVLYGKIKGIPGLVK